MDEIYIIQQIIRNEKLAVQDQFMLAIAGGLLAAIAAVSLPTLATLLVGPLAVANPIKEIINRRETIRDLEVFQYAYSKEIAPEKVKILLKLADEIYTA